MPLSKLSCHCKFSCCCTWYVVALCFLICYKGHNYSNVDPEVTDYSSQFWNSESLLLTSQKVAYTQYYQPCSQSLPLHNDDKQLRRGRAWYPFARDARHRLRQSYNELICYVTTRACRLLCMAAIDRQREDYTDGDDSERSYLIIQAAGDTGTVQYQLQNATYSFLTLQ